MKKSTSRGRPKTSAWEKTRAIIWAEVARENSKSVAARAMTLKGEQLSGKWAQYAIGRSPSSQTLDKVDVLIPNTRRVFNSAIWRLTQVELVGRICVRQLFTSALHPLLRDSWVKVGWEKRYFWRHLRPVSAELDDIFESLAKGAPWDIFSAIAVLIHEAVVLQDLMRFKECVTAFRLYLDTFSENSEICQSGTFFEKMKQFAWFCEDLRDGKTPYPLVGQGFAVIC